MSQDQRLISFAQSMLKGVNQTQALACLKTLARELGVGTGLVMYWRSQSGELERVFDEGRMEVDSQAVSQSYGSKKIIEGAQALFIPFEEGVMVLAQAPVAAVGGVDLSSEHPMLGQLLSQLHTFARSDSSILVEGESGTGKEVIARAVHARSLRHAKPFVAVNCAAIPESLFEAELFGVAKGAATGTAARKGKIEQAQGGTLFLDEIGELPLSMQAKLLRVLQDKTVVRVGSDESPKEVDFRLISATNQDLENMVRRGGFRDDLYFRINVIRMGLPPLRERQGDLPGLAQKILDRLSQEREWPRKTLTPAALERLAQQPWPGNIRELQNRLETAMVLSGARTELGLEDLPFAKAQILPLPKKKDQGSDLNLKRAKDDVERQLILEALERTGGNKTQAAKLLGITREGLRKAMDKLGLRAAS